MLDKITIKNFTVFQKAVFHLSPGLNVIIGPNGSGKSHLLKLAYSVAKTSYRMRRQTTQSKAVWQKALADDLIQVFRPESLGRLARRQQGQSKAEVGVTFEKLKPAGIQFDFSTKSNTEVQLKGSPPQDFAPQAPIFVPAKELLSLFPGLTALYNNYELAIDATYPDLCDRLNAPLLRGVKLAKIEPVLQQIEQSIDGEVKQEGGRFYLYTKSGRLEIDLVAEGLRKLATLSFLLRNGSLNKSTTLFWDEPDANLNPRLIKQLAAMLFHLAKEGFQIVLATHSLFLLKEFHILEKESRSNKLRYFSLTETQEAGTEVTVGDELDSLPTIASLEAELEQTDRFEEALHE